MAWLVAQTKSRSEDLAMKHLATAGFEAYLPRIKIRGNANKKSRVVPLFPNYLFVLINGVWGPVMRTIGISRVIRNGDEPARVEQHVIDEIRGREKGGIVQLPKPKVPGEAGQRVRILRGPFAGHVAALCDAMTEADRQKVLLDILGRKTVIELDRADMTLDIGRINQNAPGNAGKPRKDQWGRSRRAGR